ncbi:hypothetical protein CMT89_05865 [Elizabethkingia anophelis]|nr:hypothetical protein AL491_11815 [Elizabethkingia anophelis]AVF52717.1 hypothetical protein AL492_14225 [Elizabethkingia anophelis]MDV3900713.1 hypothetical protein [Elizabethkingia anophelis]MDV4058909.1 hypothetical protein [Elizabethkingia anophelis]
MLNTFSMFNILYYKFRKVKSGMYYKYMEDVYIIQLLISVEVKKREIGTNAEKTIYLILFLRHKEFYPTIKISCASKNL